MLRTGLFILEEACSQSFDLLSHKILSIPSPKILGLGGTVSLKFDSKTNHEIVFRGHVIKNDTERSYIEALIGQFKGMEITQVLEVGFGLGISAMSIQTALHPKQHDIYEIEANIYVDCSRFCQEHPGSNPHFEDFYTVNYDALCAKYDLFFDDSYDYNFPLNNIQPRKADEEVFLQKEFSLTYDDYVKECFEKSRKIALQVLKVGGYYCTIYFGGNPPRLAGFEMVRTETRSEDALRLWDESVGSNAQVFYYKKLP